MGFQHTDVLSAAAPHVRLPGAGGSPISIALKCLALQEQPWASLCRAEPGEQLEPGLFYEVCTALAGAGSPLCPSSPPPATSRPPPSARHPALASGPGAVHSWTVFLGCLEQQIPTAFLSQPCSSLYITLKPSSCSSSCCLILTLCLPWPISALLSPSFCS